VVALQPSIFSGHGADEFDRFRRGAESRGEIALVISPIGDPDDHSVYLSKLESHIASRALGTGAKVRASANLSDADRDLARRLVNCNPPLPWRSLSLHGLTHETHSDRYRQHAQPAQGALESIVETELGEPVVAAWVSPDDIERRYVVPAEMPWPLVLQWILEHALPAYVPNAVRRARRPLLNDDALVTRRERAARTALTDFEVQHKAHRAALERELEEARTAASGVRDGLLYGTGTELVQAVRVVLETAGMTVHDLDLQLGGTKNADLLCTYGGRSRLIEVKSASGNAPERAYEALVRHLREWQSLPKSAPVEGGALVLNHQHRMPPPERSQKPYGRPEFLAAQTEPVVTTLEFCAAWREEDWGAVRALVFDESAGQASQPAADDVVAAKHDAADKPPGRRRGWLRRR
jgi:hypothetical protein